MSSSDPQHVPDIVSGHAASNQNSVKPKDKSVTPFEPLDQQDGPLSMGPPSRPPRKQKNQYDGNESRDSLKEVGYKLIYLGLIVNKILRNIYP